MLTDSRACFENTLPERHVHAVIFIKLEEFVTVAVGSEGKVSWIGAEFVYDGMGTSRMGSINVKMHYPGRVGRFADTYWTGVTGLPPKATGGTIPALFSNGRRSRMNSCATRPRSPRYSTG